MQKHSINNDSSHQLNDIFNACGFGIIIIDESSKILYWNKWVSKNSHVSLDDVKGQRLEEIFPILGKTRLLQAIKDALEHHLPSTLSYKLNRQMLPLSSRNGKNIEHNIKLSPLKKTDLSYHCLVEITDISAAIKRENQLREISDQMRREKEWANVTLMSIADAVITTDQDGSITSVNEKAENLTGFSRSTMIGKFLSDICPISNAAIGGSPHPITNCLENRLALTDTDNYQFLTADGNPYAVNLSIAAIIDLDNTLLGAVMTFRDITQSRHISDQLSWQAKHDHLTGLLNRRELETKIEEHRLDAKHNDNSHNLMYIDLDQFKIVNDTCGHGVGDKLLKRISQVFQDQLRKDDILARIGGDEFCVLLPMCPAKNALSIANTLRQATLEYRFVHDNKPYMLGASIGLTAITGFERNAAEILSAADSACYSAKSLGRNRVQVHNHDTNDEQPQQVMQWFSRLQSALEEDRFILYAQEIASIHEQHTAHYEVLIRMLDQDGNIVPPNSFIPAAERFNLMQSIDRWVLKKVCQYFSGLQKNNKKLPVISINLSGISVGDTHFLEETTSLFEEYNTPTSYICFEITETAAISNLKDALTFMTEMKKRDCKFSLDDFGSGLSSFTYLKTLPVDYLKIDGQFVKNITHDLVDKEFVESIHKIAQVMNIKTIAEFVENDQILNTLKDIGIHYAQGYGISRPVPLDSIELH